MNVRALPMMLLASLVGLLCLLQVVKCQFLQPQSHLGRLVQSIASPLVLSSAYAGDSGDSEESPTGAYGASAGLGVGESAHENQPGAAQHFQHYQREQHLQQPTRHHQYGQPMEQAPSQERGVPQHLYTRTRGGSEMVDNEDAAAPSSPHKQRSAAREQYQMGAYLGPTIDDKEIQGAFNSKDDERDDDESAAGFVGPPSSAANRQRAASSAQYLGAYGGAGPMGNPDGESSYGQHDGSVYGRSAAAMPAVYPTRGESSSSFDDENGADEDDESSAAPSRRGRGPDSSRFRTSGQAAAASQYHQQRRQHSSGALNQQQQQQMQAAANGYSPYGYPAAAGGPIDLSSLMAAAGGPDGYQVYNGDGSYPGAGYYQQQQVNGRRKQAGSNMMGAGPYGPYGGQAQQPGARGGDSDEQDSDADEDRA